MEFIDNMLDYTSGIVIAIMVALMLVFVFAVIAVILDVVWRLIQGMIRYRFRKGWLHKTFDNYYG